MSRQVEGFQPTEEVTAILEGLQDAGYGWIADEIRGAIVEGRTLREESTLWGPRRKAGSHVTVPLDATEQMQLALLTILRYTVELYETWVAAVDKLRQLTHNPQLTITVSALESDAPIPLFAPDYDTQLAAILDWIRRLWPGGTNEFELILTQARGRGRQ